MSDAEVTKKLQAVYAYGAHHSNSRTTLEVYSQARIRAKREAQQRVVEMIMPKTPRL